MNNFKMIQIMNHMLKDMHKECDIYSHEIKNLVINLVNTTDLYELDGINLFKEFLLTGVLNIPKHMGHSKKTKMGGCLA